MPEELTRADYQELGRCADILERQHSILSYRLLALWGVLMLLAYWFVIRPASANGQLSMVVVVIACVVATAIPPNIIYKLIYRKIKATSPELQSLHALYERISQAPGKVGVGVLCECLELTRYAENELAPAGMRPFAVKALKEEIRDLHWETAREVLDKHESAVLFTVCVGGS